MPKITQNFKYTSGIFKLIIISQVLSSLPSQSNLIIYIMYEYREQVFPTI